MEISFLDRTSALFFAGGWVSWSLVLLVGVLFYALGRRSLRVRELRSELRGAQVRGGHLAEALAPLIADFPVKVGKEGTTTVFLGQPVDYVHFDPDEGVTFVEVKSGESGLSTRQRRLREQVEAGRVHWQTYRVK